MNSKSTVNKDLEDRTLQDQTGEGTFSLEECSAQKPVKKKKCHRILTPEQQAKRATFKKVLTMVMQNFS